MERPGQKPGGFTKKYFLNIFWENISERPGCGLENGGSPAVGGGCVNQADQIVRRQIVKPAQQDQVLDLQLRPARFNVVVALL